MSQVTTTQLHKLPAPFVSIATAAQQCGVHRRVVNRLLDRGQITAHAVEGWPHRAIHRDDLPTITRLTAAQAHRDVVRSETPTATPSARLKGLQRFEQAAESCGVGTGTLMNFIRRGQIKPVMIAKASHIRVRDFDRIRELAFDLPAPGDPTPEEIAERCRLVRQRGCSADADVESDVLAILAKRSLSITEIKTRLSRKQADTRSTLERLVSSGAVIKSDGPLTRYCRAGSDSMLESADQILCRFRQRACTKSRRRCVAA